MEKINQLLDSEDEELNSLGIKLLIDEGLDAKKYLMENYFTNKYFISFRVMGPIPQTFLTPNLKYQWLKLINQKS